MATGRQLYERTEGRMGEVVVDLTVENLLAPGRRVACKGMVDTGAYGLVLPTAWKRRLGKLPVLARADLELADQRIVPAEICGPAGVQIDGFRRVAGEVIFVEMVPRPNGTYEPLIGYTLLELANVVVDMRRRCLVARRYYDLKRCVA